MSKPIATVIRPSQNFGFTQVSPSQIQTGPFSYQKGFDSKSLGAAFATIKALQTTDYPEDFSRPALLDYYKKKFNPDPIPDPLLQDLDYALERPEVFEPLFFAKVLPLDPKIYHGSCYSFAEFLRDAFFYDQLKEKVEQDLASRTVQGTLEAWIDTQIVKFYGEMGYNNYHAYHANDPYWKDEIDKRPELQKVYRITKSIENHASLMQSIRRARKDALRKDLARFPFTHPGVFCDTTLTSVKNLLPRQKAYRVMWRQFQDLECCLDYLLNTGERAPTFFLSNSGLTLFQAAKNMRDYIRDYGGLNSDGTAPVEKFTESSNAFAAKKFFLSFSQNPLNFFIDDGCPHEWEIQIESDRFFGVPNTFSNYGETEIGLPLVVNPREIVEVRRFLNVKKKAGETSSPFCRDPSQMIVCKLHWNESGTHCAAEATNTEENSYFTIVYTYDAKTGRFRKI